MSDAQSNLNQNQPISQTDEDWQAKLTPEQYRVLRQAGTEIPYTGEFVNHTEDGMYVCAGCGQPLFSSETKYDGGGWPSFWDAVDPSAITTHLDESHNMIRTEVRCSRCGGHLGHLFEGDSRSKTGQYYCINSAALDFKKE